MSYIYDMRKYIGHKPMIAAGATVVVIKDNKILLNLRSDTNTWGIPGGSLELGETDCINDRIDNDIIPAGH